MCVKLELPVSHTFESIYIIECLSEAHITFPRFSKLKNCMYRLVIKTGFLPSFTNAKYAFHSNIDTYVYWKPLTIRFPYQSQLKYLHVHVQTSFFRAATSKGKNDFIAMPPKQNREQLKNVFFGAKKSGGKTCLEWHPFCNVWEWERKLRTQKTMRICESYSSAHMKISLHSSQIDMYSYISIIRIESK